MGNTANKTTDAASGAYSPTPREENVYDPSFMPSSSHRYSHSNSYSAGGGLTQSTSAVNASNTPPIPPRGIERRSQTVVVRDRQHSDAPRQHPGLRRVSTSDMTTSSTAANAPASSSSSSVDPAISDELSQHVVDNRPKEDEANVELGSSITVFFDKDVRTVNINKLFELHCDSVDSSQSPIKGRISYDARQLRAEFTPHNTLYPNAKYTVILMGRAVTTTQCSHGSSIKNAEIHFNTCNPPPKSIGIKLKGKADKAQQLQIANYYDLFNSLIVWSTRKWGCSGEHIIGMYIESEEGKLHALKADHDVLNLKENTVVLVEIKD